jgi:hypothetical protein
MYIATSRVLQVMSIDVDKQWALRFCYNRLTSTLVCEILFGGLFNRPLGLLYYYYYVYSLYLRVWHMNHAISPPDSIASYYRAQ